MMKRTSKQAFIFLLFSFVFSQDYSPVNIYWEPEFPNKGDKVTIYADVSDSDFRYAYQINIHFSTDLQNYSTYAMNRDYGSGMFIWTYQYDVKEDTYFEIGNNDNANLNTITIKSSDVNPFIPVKDFLLSKDYGRAITLLENISSDYPNQEMASDAEFMIAEIYLNDFKEYKIASDYYASIIDNYSKSFSSVKKSMFTLGYIYANYLEYYSDAIAIYRQFKATYPNDALLPSVDYELNLLSDIEKSINSLLNSSK